MESKILFSEKQKIEWQLSLAGGRGGCANVGNLLVLMNCWKILANKAPFAEKRCKIGDL